MPPHPGLDALRTAMVHELTGRLLPFWTRRAPDATRGGFIGRIAGSGEPEPDAPRGAILNARILWTFAAAYRLFGNLAHGDLAARGHDWFDRHFVDPIWGGVYWMVDVEGRATDDRKHAYAQSFAIYGLTEHYRATGHERALRRAIEIFNLLEKNALDRRHGGYLEAFSRSWERLEDQRLSETDADVPKSMNTHLHILEALTNLCRAWPDPWPLARLRETLEIFLGHILDDSGTFVRQFFGEDWTPVGRARSFGHDIEASWLLLEAADVLGDRGLRSRVLPASIRLADSVLESGVGADGGLFNGMLPDGTLDDDRHWWPQAEAVVGFVGAYQETGEERFLEAAETVWAFIERRILDMEGGEWHWRVDRAGRPYAAEDKVGPWKGPYHGARACMEVMERADLLLEGTPDGTDDGHGALYS